LLRSAAGLKGSASRVMVLVVATRFIEIRSGSAARSPRRADQL
jgi:hypothetical protein